MAVDCDYGHEPKGYDTRISSGAEKDANTSLSFAIDFFPVTNSNNPSTKQLQCVLPANRGRQQLIMNCRWTNCFGPISHTRLPAWSRVISTARSSKNINGTIMKRVGKPQRRQPRSLTDLSRGPHPRQPTSEEPVRVVRRRLDSYQPTKKTAVQGGRPLTKLEIASLKMQAKCKRTRFTPAAQ